MMEVTPILLYALESTTTLKREEPCEQLVKLSGQQRVALPRLVKSLRCIILFPRIKTP
jgi:hypothetical protein